MASTSPVKGTKLTACLLFPPVADICLCDNHLSIQNVLAKLTALVNDTTGTLIASNYVDPHTKIAVIFGTGCNAAYMETGGNIPKMDYVGLPADQGMAINVRMVDTGIGGADHCAVRMGCLRFLRAPALA